jgi:lipopolysaccharide/colanic/teichoic acid biosynthesis glycosyltransferase
VPTTKRIFDIAVASVGLVLALPIILLTAIAILIEDGAPVLFLQKRLGRHGKLFHIYKFRKFRTCASVDGSMVTRPNDLRYSRVGKVIDKLKLNELPQLLNVIKGDMSIVGPRPEIPEFCSCFGGQHARLLDIKPGIFGPSQAMFRNEMELYPADQDPHTFYAKVLFPSKAAIDLHYYTTSTLRSDAVWVVKSVGLVLQGSARRGAR